MASETGEKNIITKKIQKSFGSCAMSSGFTSSCDVIAYPAHFRPTMSI